ncbi:hypothetical protein M378DRAFT_952569 [Amanita muscaria Koide BX008]|uniref:Uncharacterized protein n=1 Tax=Amanita muscaria (strain Koide BX008) TaxID=946122 RepID=A0A0C2SBD1_AMAMK|nr:hypothetical protein M378DRAFT_952569 [Amanita muscaria Koide BX008]
MAEELKQESNGDGRCVGMGAFLYDIAGSPTAIKMHMECVLPCRKISAIVSTGIEILKSRCRKIPGLNGQEGCKICLVGSVHGD